MQPVPAMRLYSTLSRLPVFKSYRSKIMLVAFLGTHVPLLTLLFWFLLSQNVASNEMIQILLIALGATLAGTLATLIVLNALLRPILVSSRALREFLNERSKVALPTHFTDEAGTLMADTTVTLNRLHESMDQMENFDATTGLPNRSLFLSRLQRVIDSKGTDSNFAVILIDLSRLSEWNVSYSAPLVSELVRHAGSQMEKALSERGLVARISDSTFAMLLSEFGSQPEDALLTENPESLLGEPFRSSEKGETIHIETLAAVALFPGDGKNAEELLTNAYTALHDARDSARPETKFYSREMQERIERRLSLEQGMRRGLDRQEFELFLQPRLELATNRILSAEALIRWPRPEGMVSPLDFIPVAESSGYIQELGQWILRDALRILRKWMDVVPTEIADLITISVNFSPYQFAGDMSWVLRELDQLSLPGHKLEIEVTESVFLSPSGSLNETMQLFRNSGLSIALDDFGTGYSSLSYLRDFPVDRIKIDRSFIQGLPGDSSASAIVGSVIELARALEMATTVEGVETKEQLDFLRIHGCDEIQGFYFAKPMDEANFLELVSQKNQ